MICVLNIGNTNTAVGFGVDKIEDQFTIPTHAYQNPDEFIQYFKDQNTHTNIEQCIIASVRPKEEMAVKQALDNHLGIESILLSHNDDFEMDLGLYASGKLGMDRILAMYGAKMIYGENIAVVDLGTATTINVLSNNQFKGGAIMTGVRLGLSVLSEKTGLLPYVNVENTTDYLGLNTEDSLKAGALFSTVATLKEYQRMIMNDYPDTSFVITGGNAKIILPLCDTHWNYEPDLVLHGILSWWGRKEIYYEN